MFSALGLGASVDELRRHSCCGKQNPRLSQFLVSRCQTMTVLVSARSSLAFVLILSGLSIAANGQRNRAIAALDETQLVSLTGNTHPLARAKYDLGSVDAETRLDRMILVLMPTAAQQAELDLLVEAQQDAASSQYHQWLTPAEFGARFGASDLQLQQVTAWLTAHGFAIEEIAANHRLIVFSGTAAQVTETFHTAIHRYSIDGVEYIANAQDPQIPASLIGVVGGVVSLHNFRRTSAISSLRKVSAKQLGAHAPSIPPAQRTISSPPISPPSTT